MKVVNLEDCINEIKSLDNCGFITRSTNHVCEDLRTELKGVEAVPLDRIKQARAKIEDRIDNYPDRNTSEYEDCLAILDKLIEEAEE